MKRMLSVILLVSLTLAIPAMVVAMSHGEHGSHGKPMSHDMHNGKAMATAEAEFVEVGKDVQDGVVATVKIKTYDDKTRAAMAGSGVNATHHVMVFFTDEKSGEAIADGKAALKIRGDGHEDKPIMLMQKETGFGADVSLQQAAMVTFEVGSKLADGNTRQFESDYHNH